MSTRRLVVSGDDFGVAPEVNAAIVRAHEQGILTAASLMVTGAAATEAAALARGRPTLAVGLHLVLAQGRPASELRDVPRLVTPSGSFRDQPVWSGLRYAWAWLGNAGRDEIRREVEAQLAAFAATGLPLTHVDGHLNMHLHPMVLPILLEVGRAYGVRAVRLSREDLGPALRYDRRHFGRKLAEGTVFRVLAAYAAPRLRAAGVVTVDRVYGLHQSGHVDERYLLTLIAELPPGTSELYCHPADGQPAVLAPYQVGYDHEGEVTALTSPRVRAALDVARVELVSYRDL